MRAIRKILIVVALAAMGLATAANGASGAALAGPRGTGTAAGTSISGTVENDSGAALADISVQVCLSDNTECYTTTTGTSGFYSITGLGNGSYQVYAQDSPLLSGQAGPVTIANGFAQVVNLVLLAVIPLPPGVIIPGANGNPPVLNWGQATPFSAGGRCPNGVASFKITQNGAVIAAGPMTETPNGSGTYSGLIPAFAPNNQGFARVTVTVSCPNGTTQVVPFNIKINGPAPPPACSAAYSVPAMWSGGFQGQVVVTDTGSSPVNGWTLTWTFPGDQQITSLWNGAYTQSGENVTVTSTSYDGTIQPGGSVSVGFNASYSGTDTGPSSVTCA